jgi:hypothetical protein
MMFQVAAMESLGKDYEFEVNYLNVVDHLNEMNQHQRTSTYNPIEYLTIFENFNWNSKISHISYSTIEVPFAFVELHPKENDTYWGYFQSEKYFKHNKKHINYLFSPSEHVREKLKQYDSLFKDKTTCSIHVRRGDYLKYPDTHFVQNMDYFENALAIILSFEKYLDKVIVFSDDIEWCKENFNKSEFLKDKNLVFIEDEKDYIELFLMSQCTHNICSNSSFSWWGAWLNSNENKKVVAPKKWWAGYDADIVPNEWIKF